MSDEDDNVLTFSELRKTQKEEDREEELTELGDKFLLRVSNYFDKKKEAEGESREYKNARRVLDKILSLREEKIVKKTRLSVRTDTETPNPDLLPEEQELFRNIKSEFKDHRSRVDEMIDSQTVPGTGSEPSEDVKAGPEETQEAKEESVEDEKSSEGKVTEEKSPEEETVEEEESQEDEEESREVEDGYKLVETTSDVPEFMGTDLEAYGPFDAGEEIAIPDDNAEILVNRGNAELVEE